MRIIRATHLGMCFGVRDAIATELADRVDDAWLGDRRFLDIAPRVLDDG